jgi:hypothetical protein
VGDAADGVECRRTVGTVGDGGGERVLDLRRTVEDEILLGRKVVVHGLLGDVGDAGDVGDCDGLEASLGEEAGRGSGDPLGGLALLALSQPRHRVSIADRLDTP